MVDGWAPGVCSIFKSSLFQSTTSWPVPGRNADSTTGLPADTSTCIAGAPPFVPCARALLGDPQLGAATAPIAIAVPPKAASILIGAVIPFRLLVSVRLFPMAMSFPVATPEPAAAGGDRDARLLITR